MKALGCNYSDLNNLESLKVYAEKATPAIKKFSGKILVRGGKTETIEHSIPTHIIIIQACKMLTIVIAEYQKPKNY